MALGLTPKQIIEKNKYPLLNICSNWERVLLGNIIEIQNGYAFSSINFTREEGVPLIRIRDIADEQTENYFNGEYSDDFLVQKGDFLIGMDGDFKLSKWPGERGLLNQRVCRLRNESKLYNKQFLFFVLQPYLNAIHSETSSVTVKHLSSRTIADIPIPLPPVPEQRAIVKKLENLFSSLDAGVADLKKAQQQLKMYRQAVLKKAFEGDNSWCYKSIKDVIKTIDGDRSKNYPKKNEFFREEYCLFLSTKNVRNGKFLFEENIFITKDKDDELRSGKLERGDVVLTTRGTLGNVALFDDEVRFDNIRINSGMLILRIKDNKELNQKYLMNFINSPIFFDQLKSKQSGTAQPQIPANILKEIIISFPQDKEEQLQIVKQIESRLSFCDSIEHNIKESLEKAEALRQSILKKAFEGNLLTAQELAECKMAHDYEPAGVLLERIKAEQTDLKAKPAKKKAVR